MKLTWVFDVGTGEAGYTYYWAFDDITLGGHNYEAKILKKSFSGITLRWDIAGNGLIAPNELTFDVSDPGYIDPGSALFGVDYTGWKILIKIYEGSTLKRSWKMICARSIGQYGTVRFYCHDFLYDVLDGDYPLTQNPKNIWMSLDDDPGDYVIPVILGDAYVPVISVNTGTQRYYPIGASTTPTYTIEEVRSPHNWDNTSVWNSEDYTFNQSNLTGGIKGVQVIIADSDFDGIVDAPGLWKSGNTFLPMLIKMTRSDTVDLINPAEWVKYFCEDIGISSSDIDSVSFSAAETDYDGHGIEFNGGWWHSESKESALSSILAQCDSYINVADKIELYQFDATEVETFTNLIKDSFRSSKITSSKNDSGYVEWQKEDAPQDILLGKTLATTGGASLGTKEKPSDKTFSSRFLNDSVSAQKAAILYFQKKDLKKNQVSFSVAWPSISTRGSIHPGQVIEIDNPLYGDLRKYIITGMTIKKDFCVDFQGVSLSTLYDWGTVSGASEVTIADEDVWAWEPADDIIKDVIDETTTGGLLNDINFGFTGTTDDDADYDFVGFYTGAFYAGDTLIKIPFVRDIDFAVNLGGMTIKSRTEPAFDLILKVFKNDSEIGFIEFVAGDVNGIFYVDAVTCTTTDTLTIICQAVSDGWGILTGNPEFVWGS